MKYRIILERTGPDELPVYRATWWGDPGRTYDKKCAKEYSNMSAATYGLAIARKFRDFKDAVIEEVIE
jgi:hypothetical protein